MDKDQYPCKEIAVIYAEGLFNMTVDDPDIKAKRGYISDLQNLLKEYPCQDVAVEYASGLVNMTVDDPDIKAKRGYLSDLQNLLDQYPCEEIADMYAMVYSLIQILK